VPKDVTERRERTHDLYVIRGLSQEETVDRVTSEFDAAPSTVRDEIRCMSEWVGELVQADPTGESRIRELREARGRLYHLALDAREAGDPDLERKIVSDIVSAIATDVELCQSLGLTVDADRAGQIALPEDVDAEDPITGLADRDPAVLSASR
jgi:hypothetical protein